MSMFRSIREFRVAVILSVALTIGACGSGAPSQATRSNANARVDLILVSNETRSEKTGIGPGNLLTPCEQPWLTWTGEPSGVRCATPEDGGSYNPNGALYISAPTDGSALTIGVRRYDRPLRQGFRYTLSAGSTSDTAAVIFLFDQRGALVPVPGYVALATARPGQAVSFIAPASIAGFFIQVQSAWEATEGAVIAPYIPNEPTGGGQLDVRRGWTDWTGNRIDDVNYNGLTGHTFIGVPHDTESLKIGVQHYDQALTAGQVYELTLSTNNRSASLLLFMFDANDQLISANGASWVSVTAPAAQVAARDEKVTTRFQAPMGIVSFAVQIQGEYNADEASFAYPELNAVDGRILSCFRPLRGAPIHLQPIPTREYAVYVATNNHLTITGYADVFPVNDPDYFQTIATLEDGYRIYRVEDRTGSKTFEYHPETGDVRRYSDSPIGPLPAANCLPD